MHDNSKIHWKMQKAQVGCLGLCWRYCNYTDIKPDVIMAPWRKIMTYFRLGEQIIESWNKDTHETIMYEALVPKDRLRS